MRPKPTPESGALDRVAGESKRWTAHGPGVAFVTSPIKDVCYGGARGGMKTVHLLIHIQARVAKYGKRIRGAIFRKSYPELAEVIRKGREYLCRQNGWKFTDYPKATFTSPEGATLMVRYAETLADAMLYDGFEWTDLEFDEIGNWPTSDVCDYLLGCLRSGDGVPCVRRSTCMPGGPGHVWVKQRYQPDKPWTLRRIQPLKERPDLTLDTFFIPARMEDNPFLNHGEYEANLAATASPALFRMWREGNWNEIRGAFFEAWDEETMTVERPVIRDWDIRWLSIDWGYKHRSAIYWHAQDENRNVTTYRELVIDKTSPAALGRLIAEHNNGEKLEMVALSPDAFAQRHSPRTIADEISSELIEAGLPAATRADDDRLGGWMLCNQLLVTGKHRISTACPALIECIPTLQRDPKKPEDVLKMDGDDPADGWRYGLKTFLRESRVPREELLRRYVKEHAGEYVVDDEEKVIGGRIHFDNGEVETEADAAARWTRIARTREQAERYIGTKRSYGRRPTWGARAR